MIRANSRLLAFFAMQMLWNWFTVDACFLTRTWHVRSSAGMAASCIGVVLLTFFLELLRRLGKEYDALLARGYSAEAIKMAAAAKTPSNGDGESTVAEGWQLCKTQTFTFRAKPVQQLARAVIHAITFGVAYIIMLLAMYFNGFIIISIFIGAGIGKFVCDWLVVKVPVGDCYSRRTAQDINEHAISETTVCCG